MYKLEVTTADGSFVHDFTTLETALAAIKMAMQGNAVVKLWKEE